MKHLITATACTALLMAFLIQFLHLQVMYQQTVMANHAVDVFLGNQDQSWLQEEISRIAGCSKDAVQLVKLKDEYQIRFPMDSVIASPNFWGIDTEKDVQVYVIERQIKAEEGR